MDYINRRQLLLNQRKNNQFSRLDVVVRNCFLSSIGTSKYAFYRDLYKKMQFIRTGHNNHIKGVPWVEEFLLLDRSFYKEGYLEEFPLVVNEDKHLINSSHRAALCLHHKIDKIPISICKDWKKHLEKSGSKTKTYFNYGKTWFEQNNFSDVETRLINNAKKKLFEDLNLFFYVILWPPVEKYFLKIYREIEENYEIINYKQVEFKNNLESVMKDIYEVDNIEEWKLEKKIQSMKESTTSKSVFILKINLFATKFRNKIQHPDCIISEDAELIKRRIRDNYRDKVNKYFYDIIVHMSDNYEHVDHIREVLKKHNVEA